MIIEFIKTFSSDFIPFFKNRCQGHVHSVYRHTINTIVDNELCSIQDMSTPISSLSINLHVSSEDFAQIIVQPDDIVQFDVSGIYLGSQFYSLSNAKVFDPNVVSAVPKLSSTQVKTLMQSIICELDESDFGKMTRYYFGKQDDTFGVVGKYLYPYILKLMDPSDEEADTEVIGAFVGAGNGLTPSGDDFLCGMLAAIFFLPDHPLKTVWQANMVETIQLNLQKTTLVSAAFLKHATKGKFSYDVKQLFLNARGDLPCHEQIEKIKHIGHSSGTDFLSGLVFGLEKGGVWI